MILSQIKEDLTTIAGVGEKNKKLLAKVGITSICDLLNYMPRKYSDRSNVVTFKEAITKTEATVQVEVTDYRLIKRSRGLTLLKIMVTDGADYGSLVFYNQPYMQNTLLIGQKYNITGRFVFTYGEFQSSNFEVEPVDQNIVINNVGSKIMPIYPLTERLTQKVMRHATFNALKKYLPQIEDELPSEIIRKNGLLHSADVLRNIHYPIDQKMFLLAKKTQLYTEFFYQQMFLIARKNQTANTTKKRTIINFEYQKKIIATLPFELTDYQKSALEDINKDLFSNRVMSRLLQGDVGCGKTIVATLAMANVAECGLQAAIMVPTEMLAKQHFDNIGRLCVPLGLKVALLQSKQKKQERNKLLQQIKSGEINIIVATHSAYSQNVEYNNLGLVVIDEQHRFGVEQRLALQQKGEAVDLLLMSATPIPQSLALSLYGDLEFTVMRGKISGRKLVKTWVIDDDKSRIIKMYDWIKSLLDGGGRAIIVYARIDADTEEEFLGLKDLETEYEKLANLFSDYGTAMLHSKIDETTKDLVIEKFRTGEIKLLAATTVVEVGMDIPDANVIVVENAERYGLATLHQLRGRVGRNNKDGFMVLISKFAELTEEGRKRLDIIKNCNDGFEIAEQDLMLRGPGDFIGLRQSGLPEMMVNIRQELKLLQVARDDAARISQDDPNLEKIENFNVKTSFLDRMEKIKRLEEKNNRQN